MNNNGAGMILRQKENRFIEGEKANFDVGLN